MKQFFNIIFLILLTVTAVTLIRHPAQSNEVCDCFPHAGDWNEVENHGLFAFDRYKNGIDSTIGETCRECHGTNLTGGSTGVSCYSCHAAFPHNEGWREPTSHGVYAALNGRWKKDYDEGGCKGACHGKNGEPAVEEQYEGDYMGGYAEKSCFECHQPFPHPDEWADEDETDSNDFHGNYVLQNVSMKSRDADQIPENNRCRGACHGADYSGGLSNRACFDCHEAYPHMLNWSRPTTHGLYAISFGVEESCGIGCHGKEYEGGNTEISCTNCHENFPHEANFDEGHQTMDPDDAYQCAGLCHGADLSGGASGYDCTSCHDNPAWPLFKLMASPFQYFFPQ